MPLDAAMSAPEPEPEPDFERFVVNMAQTGLMLPRADLLALIVGIARSTGWRVTSIERPEHPRFRPFEGLQ